MSKYKPLSDRLGEHTGDEWRVKFADLESVLGFPLPKSARAHRAWWANDEKKPHSGAWMRHGWEVGEIDHDGETVVFRRGSVAPSQVQPPVMKTAAEHASRDMHTKQALGLTAIVAGGAAILAGAAALAFRFLRKK